MKFPSSKSTASTPPETWPARLAHEVICAFVAGIFCVVELLVFVTEWRAKISSSRKRSATGGKNNSCESR